MDVLMYAHRLSSSELERRMYIEAHPMYNTLFDREEPVPITYAGLEPADIKKDNPNWLDVNQSKFPAAALDEIKALSSARSMLNYYHGMLLTANINNAQLLDALQYLQTVVRTTIGERPTSVIANLNLVNYSQIPLEIKNTRI